MDVEVMEWLEFLEKEEHPVASWRVVWHGNGDEIMYRINNACTIAQLRMRVHVWSKCLPRWVKPFGMTDEQFVENTWKAGQ